MLKMTRWVQAMAVLAIGFVTTSAGGRDETGGCHQCQQDEGGGGTVHFCASANCSYGSENCFEGCDHVETDAGRCFADHDHCPPNFLDDDVDLAAIVATGNDGKISEVLDEFPAAIKYNESRSAIQLFDCTGDVVDHIPVNAELALKLAEPK
jgi:hypothetical protein